eukprot:94538_1
MTPIKVKVVFCIGLINVLLFVQFIAIGQYQFQFLRSQPVSNMQSLHKETMYLSKFPNYNHKIDTITTEFDYNWCESILTFMKKHINDTNRMILYRDNFTFGGLNNAPVWANKHVSHTFTSQHHQDWFLYTSMFVNMISNGIYIDLATNAYRTISNTYFLDKCLSWHGLCIEPQSMYHKNILKYRNCKLIKNCVWNETKEMIFESNPNKWYPVLSGIKGHNTIKQYIRGDQLNDIIEMKLICKTLQSIVNEFSITHIDYLSLDVEGAELNILHGINWNKLQIDVITVERNKNEQNIVQYLSHHGFVAKIMLFEDIVFVNKNAKQKMKWIDDWINNVEWKGKIWGITPVSFKFDINNTKQ